MNSFCCKVLAASIALLAVRTASAAFGGFGVSVFLPSADDSRTQGALLMVQPVGCHGPGSSVSAKAEGLVNGVRRSIALKLVAIPIDKKSGEPDTYMLKPQLPKGGSWVIVITAKKDSLHADSLVSLDRNGKVLVVDRPRTTNWDSAKVLRDGKTKLLPWTFRPEDRVVAMQLVSGDLDTAVDYTLRARASN